MPKLSFRNFEGVLESGGTFWREGVHFGERGYILEREGGTEAIIKSSGEGLGTESTCTINSCGEGLGGGGEGGGGIWGEWGLLCP